MAWSGLTYNGLTPITNIGTDITIGRSYSIVIDLTITQGKLKVQGLGIEYEFTTSGTYEFGTIAVSDKLTFVPDYFNTFLFIGTINSIAIYEVANVKLYDVNNVLIDANLNYNTFEGVQVYTIDWNEYNVGKYYFKFTDGVDYYSDLLDVQTSHECTKLFEFECNENAFGLYFDAQHSFIMSLRLECKQWQPTYEYERNDFYRNSKGDRRILNVQAVKKYLLSIQEIPEYLHDALAIGLKCDKVKIDNTIVFYADSEYIPKWRKTSNLAPIEITILTNTNLMNTNCN